MDGESEILDRRNIWSPPARPEWVTKANAVASCLDLKEVVPLDPQSLIGSAMRNTGLSDFGADDWREPFEQFVKALDEEANLNLMGRLMTRSDVLALLEGRLRVEDMYKRHPEIEDQVIEAPIWVVGQGRTGTSILQKLLTLDPNNRTLQTSDALFPVAEVDAAGNDPRVERATRRFAMWNEVTPEMAAMHDFGGDEPIETVVAESMSFQTPGWMSMFGFVPSYVAAMGVTRPAPSLRYLRRVMKLLQWQKPGGRWVLKNPGSLRYLPEVIKVFPDVRFIWTHRDPIIALSSVVNLLGVIFWLRSDQRAAGGVWDHLGAPVESAKHLARPIDWLTDGQLPPDRLFSTKFQELVSAPLETLRRAYAYFGETLSPEAEQTIVRHFEENPQSERAAHRYSLGDSEQIAKERALYRPYQDYFDIPDEVF